jgi:myo-inositol 2-dehydrogenase / D-chiro-inositol 1-dehydrogenase
VVAPARIALLGYGRIGSLHARTIRERVPSLDVAVVSDTQASSRDAAAVLGYDVSDDPRAVVERSDIDAVLIASATETHPEHVVAAAAAGKAVFCEKPIAASLTETDAVLHAVAAAHVPLQVGFQRRFDPALVELRQAVGESRIGRPLLLRISARDPEPPPAWYRRFAGGLYVDSAIHDLDTARFALGEEVIEVASFGAALFDDLAAVAGDIDTAGTLVRFASGAIGLLDNCRTSASGFDQRIEVHGTAGTVTTENMTRPGATVAMSTGIARPRNVDFFTQRYAEAYARQFTSFAAVVRDGASPVAAGSDARAALVLALAAEQSRATHLPVIVTDIGGHAEGANPSSPAQPVAAGKE